VFGMEMHGRTFSSSAYDYGFNGKIEDSEVLSNGKWQDYGFRAYRNDICRFVSVDPLKDKYPELTTYQFASNTPLVAIDLDGLECDVKEDIHQRTIEKQAKQLHPNDEAAQQAYVKKCYNERGWAALAAVGIVALTMTAPQIEVYLFRGLVFANSPAGQQIILGVSGLTASLIDPNPNADYPGTLDDVARGVKLVFKNSSGTERFIMDINKFDFFFGKVKSTPHNLDRSLQNLKDLTSLGVKDDDAGRKLLLGWIDKARDGEIVKSGKAKNGVDFEEKRKISIVGPNGKTATLEFTFYYTNSDMKSTPKVTTFIPKT
jgi:RHS repeat-associated protein